MGEKLLDAELITVINDYFSSLDKSYTERIKALEKMLIQMY